MFEKSLIAGWGDMDFNAHMRNTAYLDKSADVRMLFFAEHGYSMQTFFSHNIGPVIKQDTVEYFKEVKLLQPIRVTLALAGLSDNGSHFLLRNEFWREDGQLAARVSSDGGWLDLAQRKLIVPSAELINALTHLKHSNDFQILTDCAT